MKSSKLLSLVVLAFLIVGCRKSEVAVQENAILDGTEKSIIVTGYSTSFAWPQMLQEMLDEHAGGERVYHVLNATIGGSPIATWNADPGSEDYAKTFGAMQKDFFGAEATLRGAAPIPSIALCQQSLQFIRSQRGPIASADDAEGIKIGADAIERHVMQLREQGIAEVFVAMHIYKEPVEPEIGNERLALAEVLKRGHDFLHAGPDVWKPTKKEYPDAFAEDLLHPGERGSKIMAEAWYRTLAGSDAQQKVIDAMHEKDYDHEGMIEQYNAWRSGT